MSLLLDTCNFDALWVDGKVVSKLFFNGDKIYDNSKWFVIGNKFSSKITTQWGSSTSKFNYATSTATLVSYCIGARRTSSNPRNTYCCSTDENVSELTDLGDILYLKSAFEYLPISSFLECKNVYYVNRFKQTTYDGDLLIKPFIKLTAYNSSFTASTNVIGPNYSGICNKYADNTDEGFNWTYLSSYKGLVAKNISILSENQVKILDNYSKNANYAADFFCKAFKTDDSTSTTRGTAYYGGFLLLEI